LDENYRPDVRLRPRLPRGRNKNPSVRTPGCVRADMGVCANAKKMIIYFYFYFLKFFFGSCRRLGKREIYNFRFLVFNPQNPQNPQTPQTPQNPQNPQTPRAPRASREEEGFFGLVPLVTHPSSIPLSGGLTPKFLSLSLHSL
jgi:hypothetical protein